MTDLFPVPPWPHQSDGVEQTIDALSTGGRSVCLTSPTGSGKTNMQIAIARWAVKMELTPVNIFTNRILLTDQTRRVFQEAKVPVGVISSSMPQWEREDVPVQIATMQTVLARRRNDTGYWVDAKLVLVDEVHQQATGASADLLNEYKDRGARVAGVTATPLGVSNVCDGLIVAGRTRDLQDAGILTYARWFAPMELDTRKLTKNKVDLSLTEAQARATWGPAKDVVRAKIVGPMLGYYRSLHPELTHTLAFAPGVKESLWGARFCHTNGIRSLHIDGEIFWCDGRSYRRDEHGASEILEGFMEEWRAGLIPVIWNRFVMREGIDEPQIKCILLATPVGSYRSFLQMVGRGLRRHRDKDNCIVIDYGGNWWRHGSVNVNVDWDSVFHCEDPDTLSKNRIAKHRETGDSVGFGCPKCGMIIDAKKRIPKCPHCGHEFGRRPKSRPIIQADGKLVQVEGEPIKQWNIKHDDRADSQAIWNNLRDKAMKPEHDNGEVTYNELYARFGYLTAVKEGTPKRPAFWKMYYPPRDLAHMPHNPNDWHRKIKDVSRERGATSDRLHPAECETNPSDTAGSYQAG